MTAVAIQQHRDMPTTIAPAHLPQKHLEVRRALVLPHQKYPVARRQVHASKYHSASIAATQQNARRLALGRPHCPQRRKQQQIRFILSQQDTTPWQARQEAENFVFFSLAPGPASIHNAGASRHSQDDVSRTSPYATLDEQVRSFVAHLGELSNKEALQTSGVMSEDFWLRKVLSKNFSGPA
jgi:hypothetical protein